jgi:hypothetical protein
LHVGSLAPLRGAAPTVDDTARLPLLHATVKESMRVLPRRGKFAYMRVNEVRPTGT